MTAYDRTERVSAPRSGAGGGQAGGRLGSNGGQRDGEMLGPYRIVEEIGEGGMGVVHLALDPRGRAVAIKVLRTHVAHDADARKRLAREVDTLSRVRDPRVASVIDADVMGPRPYIVTRYVPGPALDEVVDEKGAMAPEELARLARGIAEAIRSIHACGVVHRDIKPGNVLLEDGEPVLIDFGIAHLQDDVRHTVGGLVMGTPGYLSPELVEGAAITAATDWWGWAATIAFAASGRPPFGRARMDAVLTRVRAGDVDLRGVDPRLAPLLRAALSPSPAQRPHADDVIAALEQYAAGRAATVPTPSAGAWDGRSTPPMPPGATQVVQERTTARFPPVPDEPDGRAVWAPPPTGPRQADPSEAAYQRGWDDEPEVEEQWAGAATYDERYGRSVQNGSRGAEQYAPQGNWEDDWDDGDGDGDGDRDDGEEGWDEDDAVHEREGDPRIGLPMRTGLLAAMAIAWVGALMAWPGAAATAFLAWSVVARATDRSVTALVLRRYDHGRRSSDIPFAVVASPLHLVVGAIATVVGLLLPLGAALAGVYGTALLLAGTRGTGLAPGAPITLAVGGILGLLMAWWGPGGASLRRGSRSIVRRVVPVGLAMQLVALAFAIFGVVAGVAALNHGSVLSWNPLSGNPFGG